MANAFIVRPMPCSVIAYTAGTPSNAFNDYAGVQWAPRASDAGQDVNRFFHSISVDMGSSVAIDTVFIFGLPTTVPGAVQFFVQASDTANFTGGVTYFPGASVYAGANFGASGFGTGLWTIPDANQGLTARYWRVAWYGPARFDLTVSRIVLGKRIQWERNYDKDAAFGVRDLGSLDFSARGTLVRRLGKKLRTIAITFSNVRKYELEATLRPLMEQIGNTDMIALLTDPAEHPDRQNRCYYGPLVGDLSIIGRNSAAYQSKINMVSIF